MVVIHNKMLQIINFIMYFQNVMTKRNIILNFCMSHFLNVTANSTPYDMLVF